MNLNWKGILGLKAEKNRDREGFLNAQVEVGRSNLVRAFANGFELHMHFVGDLASRKGFGFIES